MAEFELARRIWPRLFALLTGVFVAGAVAAIGQPPKEVEDPKGSVKKRIEVEEDPVIKSKSDLTSSAPDVKLDELVRGAEEAPHPAIKELYLKYAVPFDLLSTKGGEGRIKPIETARGERYPSPFRVVVLGRDGQPGEAYEVPPLDVKKVEYYEELVLKDANKTLAVKPYGTGSGPEGWTATDQLAAAERVLGAALRFHDYARERNIRKGRGWDDLRKPLAERLREVRLLQLKFAVNSSDWPRMREFGSKLMLAYPKDAGVAEQVAAARVLEAKRLLASDKHFDHVKARELLDEFEARYPGGGGEPVKAIRAQLTDLAQRAFTRAKDKKAVGDLITARDELARAAALDPTVPGVREMQRELKAGYQTLFVGVRQFPQKMSPNTARLDSEKQVVELVFEGLLSEVPTEAGTQYCPGAAVFMPRVMPNAREFLLRTFERDATGRPGFESHDVVSTLKLLGSRTDTWTAYPLPWFDELPTPKDNNTVRVAFRQSHPDPRALLTFKLLPARWMIENGKPVDDATFAEKPHGTGPYRIDKLIRGDGNSPRELVLIDNPMYGRWRDRTGQPLIKEIRLVEVAKLPDLVEAFRQNRLHILTDVPTAELDKFAIPGSGLVGKVVPVTAANNRRIYMLAVNHRRPTMQSKLLRQGLSMAIDREAILNEVFRAGKGEFHHSMTGPFPPNSWAEPRGASGQRIALVNRDLAVTRLQAYLTDRGAKTEISLLYPSDDPLAADACAKIKLQVEGLFKDSPGRAIVLRLEPLPLSDLLLRVEDEHRYDLAYVPFDYPDDWYPFALGAMLDPLAADRGGRNWMGFLGKNTGADEKDAQLGQLLNELRAFREFGQLAAKSGQIHRDFNDSVPFIPLWQLDRHMLVNTSLKVFVEDTVDPVSPRVLNPTALFQGVARWRLE